MHTRTQINHASSSFPSQNKAAEACERAGNTVQAGPLYAKAAEGGHAGAQCRLGDAYEYGQLGLKIDIDMALMWFKKAAGGGDLDAQCRLGDAYEDGQLGLMIDIEMALMWFKKAAEGGNGDAQWRLGGAYEDGLLGLPRSTSRWRSCGSRRRRSVAT